MRGELTGRVVVLSPHLDDAVLSLGLTIARAARSGARVEVLTVFAGRPHSSKPAGGWDRRAGFATEGEATAARRAEDGQACRIVGAEPSWRPFSEADYREERDEDGVWSAMSDAVTQADAMLVPGFPLTNPDHAWLCELVVGRRGQCGRLALYAEQPYRYMARRWQRRLTVPPQLRDLLPTTIAWTHSIPSLSDLRLKRRAILAYASQLPLLGFTAKRGEKLRRMLLDETLHRGEAIAWLP